MIKPYCFLILFYLCLSKQGYSQSTTQFNEGGPRLSFQENKGQVANQFLEQRQDIRFSGTDGQVSFFIRANGISYQVQNMLQKDVRRNLKRHKNIEVPKTMSISRIDINWLGSNRNLTFKSTDSLPGYDNYYLPQCANGITNVRQFQKVQAIDVYPGIDLTYYEKNGHLKSDWIIHPGADYHQIKLEIKGAELEIDKNGNLIYRTPLGSVEEAHPIAFQNGKTIAASWRLMGQTVCFSIGPYDHSKPLVIDPLLRTWSTYYCGATLGDVASIAKDASDNLFMVGITSSQTSSIIATTGAYQTTLAGQADAYIVKFNSTGSRIWGTYYGGQSWDFANDCATDGLGNIFITGVADSSAGPDIASANGHQTQNGGQTDAFLAKFSPAGLRIWATWYGGSGTEEAFSCDTDPNGNIIMAGTCNSMNGAIATTGAHQTVKASGLGSSDAFLVKFNSNGARLWGTFYGGSSNQEGYSCATDLSGNIYLTGWTSSTGTAIATTNGHQPIKAAGFNDDAFLAKFNALGVRQWGTFYGDSNSEIALDCKADANGNIFFTGYVAGISNGSVMVTPGAHQTVLGGLAEAFITKFNTNGVRLWGTFYGGTGDDVANSCSFDAANNVYLLGTTISPNTAAISTTGCYQNTLANINFEDLFIAKLNPNGQRMWGTYYGGSGQDEAVSISSNSGSGFYVAGVTIDNYTTAATNTTLFATTGAFQSTVNPSIWSPFVSKFNDCELSVIGNNSVCAGAVLSLSAVPAHSAMTSFVWLSPSSTSTTTQNLVTNGMQLLNAGIYTVTATDGAQCTAQVTVSVIVLASPTITAASGTICSGQVFSISVYGATSYTIQGGSYTVSPMSTSIYTIVGTGNNGCTSEAPTSVAVYVNPTPTISVNNGSLCSGSSHTFTPSGALNYVITGGSFTVSPTTTSTYVLHGISAQGCVSDLVTATVQVFAPPTLSLNANPNPVCAGATTTLSASGASSYSWNTGSLQNPTTLSPASNSLISVTGVNSNSCASTSVLSISVYPATQLTITSAQPTICAGETTILLSNGAQSYSWSEGQTSHTIQISPTVTTNYSVTGIDTNGCFATSVLTQFVDECTAIKEIAKSKPFVYPNPSKGRLYINTDERKILQIQVLDLSGRIIILQNFSLEQGLLVINDLDAGCYLIKMTLTDGSQLLQHAIIVKN